MICDEQRAPDSTRPSDPPPTGSSVSVKTRTPYAVDYLGEDGGKTAHYMRPRCVELSRVLKKTGSFYYHCDWQPLTALRSVTTLA